MVLELESCGLGVTALVVEMWRSRDVALVRWWLRSAFKVHPPSGLNSVKLATKEMHGNANGQMRLIRVLVGPGAAG